MMFALALGVLATACGSGSEATSGEGASDPLGEVVTPPFAVRGSAEGLVLTWYDEEGPHVASSRTEIPTEHRAEVRVDSLELSPEERDPDHVFVADLRSADDHGDYTVRRLPRDTFEDHVTGLVAAAHSEEHASAGDVIIYGASWCGACHEAQAFLQARGIPFVERDIEHDPGAREDMQRAASAAGIPTTSIPIIDFRGTIIRGFDREALERAIRASSPGQATGITI